MDSDQISQSADNRISPSFAEWLRASRQGSADDLAQLLESSRIYLLAVAELELGSTLRPKAGASDLVQESLLEAHQGFERFQGATREEFLAWIAAILRRNVLDFARRFRSSEIRSVGREETLPWFAELPAAVDNPLEQASIEEECALLNRAIDQLPEEARAVIRLRHEEQLGWDEISNRLGKSAEAVRKIWFRAVERLRGKLDGNENGRG